MFHGNVVLLDESFCDNWSTRKKSPYQFTTDKTDIERIWNFF